MSDTVIFIFVEKLLILLYIDIYKIVLKGELKMNSKKVVRLIVLLVILPILLIVISGFSLWQYENYTTKTTILSMSKIPEFKENAYTYDDVFNVLIGLKNDENIMKNYLNEFHLTADKDKVYEAYNENLLKGCEFFDMVNAYSDEEHSINFWNPNLTKGYPDSFGSNYKTSIQIVPLMKKSEYSDEDLIDTLKITYPQVPFIDIIYSGEGSFSPDINYKYLYDNYSKYLTPALRDYIALKVKEKSDLGGITYYDDGAITVSKAKLTEWIIDWQNFRDKYPNFNPKEIDKILNRYTSDFIVVYENSYFTTFDYDDNLQPKAKKAYEDFLKKVNPNTQEYKIVSKCYDVLKEHNLKFTNEFRVCVDEWSNKYFGEY